VTLERAHQQESDRRAEPPPPVAAPSPTPLDRATLLRLQRTAGNAAVARLVAARAAPPAPVVARYQAGESGHGGIEEPALRAAGFSADEAHSAYAGNWLRDLSQLPKVAPATYLIRLLSLGEFGRDTSAEELGDYVPSEHMDNPEGGGTVEDPRATPAEHAAALAKLSPAQRAAFDREEAARSEIAGAATASHLPVYIERSKFHAKEKLRAAVTTGRTPGGLRMMGDALHDVEDYFSHSNFTEACIYMLRADPAVAPLVAAMNRTTLGPNPALLTPVGADGEVTIQSGTYAPGANAWVSKLELLQSECENGQLTKAFVIGWLRMAGITGEELGRRAGAAAGGGIGSAVGTVAGGIGGAVGGAVTGAGSGAAAGYREGHGFFGKLGGAIGGFFSGLVGGAESGARSGAAAGAQALGHAGEVAGGAVGRFVGLGVAEAVAVLGLGVVLSLVAVPFAAIFAAAKTGVLEYLARKQVAKSADQAAAAGLSGPTHSQLSKDAPDHPLFAVSAALAAAADREIGAAMLAAWSAPSAASAAPPSPPDSGGGTATATATAPAFTPQQEAVAALVDKYVCHPAQQDWWQPIVRANAST
jgi:hypothetical protein